MSHPPSSSAAGNPPAVHRREAIVRLVRRICILREQGRREQADEVESRELAGVLRQARETGAAEEVAQEVLAGIFAVEQERSANAVALSELIAAQLAETLGPAAHPAVTAPAESQPVLSPLPAEKNSAGSPAIPDLLDAMLALDRNAARRAAHSRSREGSIRKANPTSL